MACWLTPPPRHRRLTNWSTQAPWCEKLRERGVTLQFDTRIEGVEVENDTVIGVQAAGETIPCDDIVFAVGMRALKGLSKSPALASRDEFRKFGNLRGTDVLATRLFSTAT